MGYWEDVRIPSRPVVFVPALVALLAALLVGALQFWRPYYFLTNDNLAFLPAYTTYSGSGPDTSHLFAGSYETASDPSLLSYRHPVIRLLGAHAGLATADLVAGLELVLAAVLTAVLLALLRREWNLRLGTAGIVFLSLSYAFCGWALVLGAGWAMYLGNQATLPLLVLGLTRRRLATGAACIALGLFHGLAAGHPGSLAWTAFYLSLLAAGLAWAWRTPRPLICWAVGGAAVLALSFPWWWPALEGAFASGRDGPLAMDQYKAGVMPLTIFGPSFFFGSLWMGNQPYENCFFGLRSAHFAALATCAAAWLTLAAARPSCRPSRPEVGRTALVLVALTVVALVSLNRAPWVIELLRQVPLLRALRWPVKEIVFLIFFIHLWIALRWPQGMPRATWVLAAAGTAVWLLSLGLGPAPSFYPTEPDRAPLLTGHAAEVWRSIRSVVPADALVLPAVDRRDWPGHPNSAPTCLVGGRNYAAWLGRTSVCGYSYTIPNSLRPPGAETDLDYGVATQTTSGTAWAMDGRPVYRLLLKAGPRVEVALWRDGAWQVLGDIDRTPPSAANLAEFTAGKPGRAIGTKE